MITTNSRFQLIFKDLKEILLPYANKLALQNNSPDEFFINTQFIMKNKKPMYFSSVKINKNYVSFHLMPVYVFSSLLIGMSPELMRRMQGKSCFNFKTVDTVLFKELSVLVEKGYLEYEKAGYL